MNHPGLMFRGASIYVWFFLLLSSCDPFTTEPNVQVSFSPLNGLSFGEDDVDLFLELTNDGDDDTAIKITPLTDSGGDWLSVEQSEGRIGANTSERFAVSVSRAGLTPGTYRGSLKVEKSVAGDLDVPVTLEVSSEGRLVPVPDFLTYQDSDSVESLRLRNEGAGSLAWTAEPDPNNEFSVDLILSGQPIQVGSLQGFEVIEVDVVVDRAGLGPDAMYTGAIDFLVKGAKEPRRVNLNVIVGSPPPELDFDRDSLLFEPTDFTGDEATKSFQVQNVGFGNLSWEATEDVDWITAVMPLNGTATPQSPRTVEVSVSRSGRAPDSYIDSIRVQSIGDGGTKWLPVRMTLLPEPELGDLPSELDFGNDKTEETLTIQNVGTGLMTWSSSKNRPWITFSGTGCSALQCTGSLTSNESTEITVQVDRSDLPLDDALMGTVSVTAGEAGSETVSIKATNLVPWVPRSTSEGEDLARHIAGIDTTGRRMYVFGGKSPSGLSDQLYILPLDADPGVWSAPMTNGMPPPGLQEHSGAFDEDGRRLIVHGGRTESGGTLGTWSYDVPNQRWDKLDDLPAGFQTGNPGVVARNTFFVFNGSDALHALDLAKGTWTTQQTNLRGIGNNHTISYIPDREWLVLTGGRRDADSAVDSVFYFDLDSPSVGWRTLAPMPDRRYRHAAVYDEVNGRLLVIGGTDDTGVLFDDVLVFDFVSWTTLLTTDPPPRRADHTAVYDQVSGQPRVIVFGGNVGDEPPFGDVWVLDLSRGY